MQKVIVTEERTITVSVRREEIRIVREPIDGEMPGAQPSGVLPPSTERTPDIALSMILSEEQVVVTKVIVPVERVTLRKHTVSEAQTVTGFVEKERVQLEHNEF